MKKCFMGIVVLLAVVTLAGCATIFSGSSTNIPISSDPPEAKVYVNGTYMGRTPLVVNLAKDKDYVVQFKQDGYEIQTRLINSKMGIGWLVLDLLSGGVPILVDAITGDWMVLDTDSVHVMLEPER